MSKLNRLESGRIASTAKTTENQNWDVCRFSDHLLSRTMLGMSALQIVQEVASLNRSEMAEYDRI